MQRETAVNQNREQTKQLLPVNYRPNLAYGMSAVAAFHWLLATTHWKNHKMLPVSIELLFLQCFLNGIKLLLAEHLTPLTVVSMGNSVVSHQRQKVQTQISISEPACQKTTSPLLLLSRPQTCCTSPGSRTDP